MLCLPIVIVVIHFVVFRLVVVGTGVTSWEYVTVADIAVFLRKHSSIYADAGIVLDVAVVIVVVYVVFLFLANGNKDDTEKLARK